MPDRNAAATNTAATEAKSMCFSYCCCDTKPREKAEARMKSMVLIDKNKLQQQHDNKQQRKEKKDCRNPILRFFFLSLRGQFACFFSRRCCCWFHVLNTCWSIDTCSSNKCPLTPAYVELMHFGQPLKHRQPTVAAAAAIVPICSIFFSFCLPQIFKYFKQYVN